MSDDRDALEDRLEALRNKVDGKLRETSEPEPQKRDMSGLGLAMRLGSEFVAGVLVGAGLGWGLDSLAGTSPWGLIIGLLLGFVAGMMNMVRAANAANAAREAKVDK